MNIWLSYSDTSLTSDGNIIFGEGINSINLYYYNALKSDAWVGIYRGDTTVYGPHNPSIMWKYIPTVASGYINFNFSIDSDLLPLAEAGVYKIVLFGDSGYTPLCEEYIYIYYNAAYDYSIVS